MKSIETKAVYDDGSTDEPIDQICKRLKTMSLESNSH